MMTVQPPRRGVLRQIHKRMKRETFSMYHVILILVTTWLLEGFFHTMAVVI